MVSGTGFGGIGPSLWSRDREKMGSTGRDMRVREREEEGRGLPAPRYTTKGSSANWTTLLSNANGGNGPTLPSLLESGDKML